MFWYTTSGITTNHLDRKSVCQRKVAHVQTSNTCKVWHAAVLFLYQQKITSFFMIKMLTLNLFSAHVCVKSITSSNGLL